MRDDDLLSRVAKLRREIRDLEKGDILTRPHPKWLGGPEVTYRTIAYDHFTESPTYIPAGEDSGWGYDGVVRYSDFSLPHVPYAAQFHDDRLYVVSPGTGYGTFKDVDEIPSEIVRVTMQAGHSEALAYATDGSGIYDTWSVKLQDGFYSFSLELSVDDSQVIHLSLSTSDEDPISTAVDSVSSEFTIELGIDSIGDWPDGNSTVTGTLSQDGLVTHSLVESSFRPQYSHLAATWANGSHVNLSGGTVWIDDVVYVGGVVT